MSAYYLDASAAVKGYVAERGSRRVLQLLEEGSKNEMHLGRIGVVELFAALFRKAACGGRRFRRGLECGDLVAGRPTVFVEDRRVRRRNRRAGGGGSRAAPLACLRLP